MSMLLCPVQMRPTRMRRTGGQWVSGQLSRVLACEFWRPCSDRLYIHLCMYADTCLFYFLSKTMRPGSVEHLAPASSLNVQVVFLM